MSGQHLRKRAAFLTSEGNSALLPSGRHDYHAIDAYLECLARFSNFVFFQEEESYMTNHLMTNFSGNSEFCLPRDQPFSVYYVLFQLY